MQRKKREERKRQNQVELERIRVERERKAAQQAELMNLKMQSPLLNDAVVAREASMYKKPREKPTESATDNQTTIQKLAWGAHDKIFGMAADIGVGKANNAIPATEEAFFSKA